MDVGEGGSSNGSTGEELEPPLKRFKHLSAIVKEKKKEEKHKEKAEPLPEVVDVENYFKASYLSNERHCSAKPSAQQCM